VKVSGVLRRIATEAGAGCRSAAFLLTAALASGCFFYDSRWGESKKAQQRAAQRYTPSALGTSSAPRARPTRSSAPSAGKVLRARVHAARGYSVETGNWQKRFAELVDAANLVLANELGVRIEIANVALWQPTEGTGDLTSLLAELRAADSGADVDLVIGLTGSLPKLVFSYHELGMAEHPGKHLLLRATNDAVEYEALQNALDELAEKERDKVYHARLVHKATSVLLHELGHALGAPHSRNASDVMHPTYDSRIQGLAPETKALLQRTVALERPSPTPDEQRAFAQAIVDRLRQGHAEHWVPSERDDEIARLESWLRQVQPVASSAAKSDAATASAMQAPPSDLRPEDQALFRQVLEHFRAGRIKDARELGGPLFGRYATSYEVQDLRCQIALAQAQAFDITRAECDALMRLTPTASPKAKAGPPRK
jgi:hypothetical protein